MSNHEDKNGNRVIANSRRSALLYLVKFIDILMVAVPFILCWFLYYANRIHLPFHLRGNLVFVAFYLFMLYIFVEKIYHGLMISITRVSEMIYSQVLGTLLADGMIYIIICFLSNRVENLVPGLLCIVGQVILIVLWCVVAHRWYYSTFKPQRSAIIYEMREGMETLINQYDLTKKFDVKKTYQVQEIINDLSQLDQYQSVFLSGVHSHDRNIILKYCVERSIYLYIIPRLGDVIMSGARTMNLFHLPMLRAERYNPSIVYLAEKRLLDILVSAIAFVITSPIFLITAIAIKTDGGPVFYKQERLTKDGKVFKVLKFRSMRVDAEKDGVARLSTGDNDDRITKVGHFIRKVRIDELPQLLNILMGDMSLVGPRPERPSIAKDYEKELPEFRLRLQAKAGLTGYAQVYGKYNTTPYDKLMMDLMYISKPRFVEDLRIIMATVKILFMAESTEGVAEGQTTALSGSAEKKSEEK